MKYLLIVLAVFMFAGYAAADRYSDNYRNDPFDQGYVQGYDHGARDAQAREDFNFRHASEYQNRSGSFRDCEYRTGYVEGYADGYFRKQPLVDVGHGYDDHRDYDRGGYHGGGGNSGFGGVTVYTEPGYRGYAQTFGVGQYRHLDGRLNDSIESLRLNGNIRIILFDDSDFRGSRVVLDRDAWNLGDFRRKAASMIIEPVGYGYR